MSTNTRPLAAVAAAGLLTVGGLAAARRLAQSNAARSSPALPQLELTPSHRAGTGTPLVLLHGVGAIWRVWAPVLPYLEAYHDVFVPTLSGHGGGPPLGVGVTPSIQALADGIEEELDRLGLQHVHIAGNSLGGWIGIELARRGRALSLVLFSPAGAWRSQRSIELRAATIRLSVGALGRYASRADAIAANSMLRWMAMAGQVAHPSRVPPEALSAFIRAGGAGPVVEPLLRTIALSQVEPLPAARDYPIRLVWGDRDRVLPFDGFGAPMLDRLPGAELVHLRGVGHVPMSDDPAKVADLILEVTTAADAATVSAKGVERDG